jgi:lipid II:glycine glycyltransferase (peptidoglycan interpeptide bridge formation enzyme)
LDLSPSPEALFAQFQKSGVQRKIRRAEREGLQYEQGRSELLLAKLFRLLQLTRRRHGLPPQPVAWFRNLIECLGDKVTLHIASHEGQSIAGILTIGFKRTLVYKYGGSDARYHNLGGMPFLFWKAIQQAKAMGLEELDLGRSDPEDAGLIDFKRHLGAASSTLTYYRFPTSGVAPLASSWTLRTAKRIFSLMPGSVLNLAGRVLYRHFG